MLLRYCATINVVGKIPRRELIATVGSMVEGATVFWEPDGPKAVQVWGDGRDVFRASALAQEIVRATKTGTLMSVSHKLYAPQYFVVSYEPHIAVPEIPIKNLLALSDIRHYGHPAVGAPSHKGGTVRLYTEWKENLPALADAYGATLYGAKEEVFGIWRNQLERSAVLDFQPLHRLSLQKARNCAHRIIKDNNQSAVLLAVIRPDGRAHARLIER